MPTLLRKILVGSGAGGERALGGVRRSRHVDLGRGDTNFDVHGLVLAGGNSIGTRGTIAVVKGTLVCDTDGSASPMGIAMTSLQQPGKFAR